MHLAPCGFDLALASDYTTPSAFTWDHLQACTVDASQVFGAVAGELCFAQVIARGVLEHEPQSTQSSADCFSINLQHRRNRRLRPLVTSFHPFCVSISGFYLFFYRRMQLIKRFFSWIWEKKWRVLVILVV